MCDSDQRGLDRLIEVIKRLRSDGGCPWDREQTLSSLRSHLIEEAYEVVDAIESEDTDKHIEELGDVLMHLVMQSRILSESGGPNLDDIADRAAEKYIRRHPHVFGDTHVSGSGQVLANWEAIKKDERKGSDESRFSGIPRQLPALLLAERVQTRVARVGFDWKEVGDVIAKIREELDEVQESLKEDDDLHLAEEIGDLLFAVVNLSRFRRLNAEELLRKTVSKFIGRFEAVEGRVLSEGREIKDCSLQELDKHWDMVKKKEKKN